ncbi:MAG: DUF1553 domain-containing protein, partial [Planctomycetes bacterium]|nr:DUF1553 domain-containing protein [Planctomycetota bacterium]
ASYDPKRWLVSLARSTPLATETQQARIAASNQQIAVRVKQLGVEIAALASRYRNKLLDESLESIADASLRDQVKAALLANPKKLKAPQKKLIGQYAANVKLSEKHLISRFPGYATELGKLKRAIAAENALEKSIVQLRGLQDLDDKPRQGRLLIRGDFNKPGKPVEPGVPAVLAPKGFKFKPQRGYKTTGRRKALAEWLVDARHPLTARVTVNRFWQQYFGVGIVKTTEEFGSQGEWPSHPQLIDWLATEFFQNGWDVKRMQKLIVMSGTYRQSSKVTPELFKKDPENRLLARGPRFRLDAEMIRDNALFLSGLLVEKIGGKSVKPYQPAGLWNAVGYTDSNTANFVQDHGDNLYRRSMYTFWKRTSPPPTMASFDAPSRESCTVRRERTNTPLQALILMNDVQFVEAARKLAERMMTEAGSKPKQRIAFAFRMATSRRPTADETAVLLEIYHVHLAEYQKDKQAALKLVSVGEIKRNEALDVSELAAWTMIANLIFNLDETVTKG